jgi:lipid II:glycine glycyltransferase (peptidoglycan interpeptide bridge formation enzyme)
MDYQIRIDNFDEEFWRSRAADFMDYSLYQTWSYQQVRAQRDGQSVSRFVIQSTEGDPRLIGQVRIKHVHPIGLRIGYIQWGPLCRKRTGIAGDAAALLAVLKEAYIPAKVNILRVSPNIFEAESGDLAKQLQDAGFEKRHRIEPYRTMLFPLETDEEGIRSRFHSGWRRYLNKTQKAELEIQQGPQQAYFEVLKTLYENLLERKGFEGLNADIFARTQQLLPDSEKMNVVLARQGHEVLTAHVSSHLGDTALGVLAGSSENALPLNSTYLVWWHTLLAANRAGMKRYDLAGIDPENNPQVYQFKQRMGAVEARHVGVFDASSNALVKSIWRLAESAYNCLKRS